MARSKNRPPKLDPPAGRRRQEGNHARMGNRARAAVQQEIRTQLELFVRDQFDWGSSRADPGIKAARELLGIPGPLHAARLRMALHDCPCEALAAALRDLLCDLRFFDSGVSDIPAARLAPGSMQPPSSIPTTPTAE